VTLPRRIPRPTWLGALGFIVLLAAWEGSVRIFAIPPYVLPSASSIAEALVTGRAALAASAIYTVGEAVAGFIIGSAIGIAAAVAIALLPRLRAAILPAATGINSVPVAAYSPLVLLWFGIGPASKIVLVAMVVSFTVFLSALAGFDRVDRRAIDLFRSFGAGRLAILWRLRLPTALPLIAAALRVSTVRSVIVAIVAEMLGARGGLGWLIYQAVVQIDFVQVWSAIFVASAASLIFFALIGTAGRRAVFWR
jgi:NitT/TauT family transport system permease protein